MKLIRPNLGAAELEAISLVFSSGTLSQGPAVSSFENIVRRYVGADHGVATSSCTTGMHLLLSAYGIGPGDEVIVPDFTFPATANVVIQSGAAPVLVDISPDTFCMDTMAIERALTPRTRAIMPVHAFGLCADMQRISEIASDLNIVVIEDAACALGSAQNEKKAGSLGDAAAFSFHPRKIVTTGEGGMITTSDGALAERLRVLGSHGGRREENILIFEEPGFNYRMSDINAAVGIVQMSKIEGIVAHRRELAEMYRRVLDGISGLRVPSEPEGYFHTYQSYVIQLDTQISRNNVMKYMRNEDIEVTLGTYSIGSQPFMQDRCREAGWEISNSVRAFNSSLTLPLFVGMSSLDVDKVTQTLLDAIHWNTKY